MEIYKDVFTKEECEYIIDMVKEDYSLSDFLIYDPETKTRVVQPQHSIRKGINFHDDRLSFVGDRFIGLANITQRDVVYDEVSVYRFNEYNTGEYINYHGDDGAKSRGAIITIGLFLNDEYTGGEFYYKDINNREILVEQPIGTVIIFDVDINHMITPVLSGTRYSINAWPKYKIKQKKMI